MTTTLSEQFQQSRGKAIQFDGQLIHPMFQKKINKNKNFLIRRLKVIDSPLQGLRIKVVGGEIEVNNQSHPEIILWADTSPESVIISVSSKNGCDLKIWNVWKIDDLTQAWVGNAGMVINEMGKVVTLECSGGVAEVDFSNLVVEIEEL